MWDLIRRPKLLALFFIASFGFFAQMAACAGPLFAQPVNNEVEIECPEGHKCVPNDVAAKWKKILEQRQCMDKALDEQNEDLQLLFEDYRVVITKDGQVFDKDDLVATLKWCDYEVIFHTKPNLAVSMKDTVKNDPTWGFRLRVRLGLNTWPKAVQSNDPLTETVLMLEPFFVHDLHLSTYAGLQTFGLVVGLDLTRNLDVFGGIGAQYDDAELGPVFGISLSFN